MEIIKTGIEETAEREYLYDFVINEWRRHQTKEEGCFFIYVQVLFNWIPLYDEWRPSDLEVIIEMIKHQYVDMAKNYDILCRFRPPTWTNKKNEKIFRVLEYLKADGYRLKNAVKYLQAKMCALETNNVTMETFTQLRYRFLLEYVDEFCDNFILEKEKPIARSNFKIGKEEF